MLVRCSHCKKMFTSKTFDAHKCELNTKSVKTIPVVYFINTSCNGKKYMSGLGLNGVLYTFEVTPREAIPIIKPIRRIFTASETDTDLTEPYYEF